MRRILTPIILSLALLAAFSGCSTHLPLTGLVVELVKLERAADGSVVATLQVENSTVVAFNVASSRHQLLLNGRVVGTIQIDEPLGVPAQRNLIQTGRLKLEGGDPVPGPASYQLNSALSFVLSGEKNEVQKISSSGTVQVP